MGECLSVYVCLSVCAYARACMYVPDSDSEGESIEGGGESERGRPTVAGRSELRRALAVLGEVLPVGLWCSRLMARCGPV